ncbi:M24 family metallopeptidase [Brumicola nitratireducens]|uniref:Xaa-Pro aminopeptidase family enzyme n=1 Tax=Glaciecola nitratireducens (strain JCM 12485 / KCTC 12276 / FR1064) TaxID=1085623 RepID=G4QIL1_GLANF|nr:M24 family metallopeptidase [Glaciecola nitratireducens]AEP31166.1 Xaa-Pro aminopeptidase family enzyme [Glaciecola nitratireducens FR1064]
MQNNTIRLRRIYTLASRLESIVLSTAALSLFSIMALYSTKTLANELAQDNVKRLSPASVYDQIMPMRERSATIDKLLSDKLNNTLPELMRREGIDMWLLISREYNEDPVLKTMLPSTWLSARRRTILLIVDPGEGKPLERYAVARYQVDTLFKKAWDKEEEPDQWQRLVDLIAQINPQKIAINKSEHFALADGITATEYLAFTEKLGNELAKRIVSSEKLAIAWLETRTQLEMELYPTIVKIGHAIIKEAYTSGFIKPGITTTDDIVWWLRDKSRSLALTNWFHPSVSIQRASAEKFNHIEAFSKRAEPLVVQRGDLLHMDFGINYLRLNTDQQQHAYVLNEGELDAPDYLKVALKNGNRLQDIFTDLFEVGKTGNEILKAARSQAVDEGIKPSIYTHPLGYHGHAAGTTLGMWDSQGGVPIQGDYPLHANTAYSIELNAATFIEQWGKEIRIMLEENAFFDGKTVTYMDGRQTEFHLVK